MFLHSFLRLFSNHNKPFDARDFGFGGKVLSNQPTNQNEDAEKL